MKKKSFRSKILLSLAVLLTVGVVATTPANAYWYASRMPQRVYAQYFLGAGNGTPVLLGRETLAWTTVRYQAGFYTTHTQTMKRSGPYQDVWVNYFYHVYK
ncbi:MAG: hypothetical protein LBI43_05170 [Streptococcaceae bacterium]|jgi:hypothetical protein|nr:hypothetical protein [Streptococcaceae bacterium]